MCIIQNFELFFLQTCFDKKKKKTRSLWKKSYNILNIIQFFFKGNT